MRNADCGRNNRQNAADDRQSITAAGRFYHSRQHFCQRGFTRTFSPMIASVWPSRSVKLKGFTLLRSDDETSRSGSGTFYLNTHFKQRFDHLTLSPCSAGNEGIEMIFRPRQTWRHNAFSLSYGQRGPRRHPIGNCSSSGIRRAAY